MDRLGEAEVNKVLMKFRCEKNPDVQRFLRKKATSFEKDGIGKTYLVVDAESVREKEPRIVGYFTVALDFLKVLDTVDRDQREKLTGSKQKKARGCYLIGQLGKNDDYRKAIEGSALLDYAMNIIANASHFVGGRFVLVDCEPKSKLIEFYEENGFKCIQTRKDEKGTVLNQYVRLLV